MLATIIDAVDIAVDKIYQKEKKSCLHVAYILMEEKVREQVKHVY